MKDLLQKATGIPCVNDALTEKALKRALSLDDATLTARGVDPAEIRALGGGELLVQEEAPAEEPAEDEALAEEPAEDSDESEEEEVPAHLASLSYADLEEMTKVELKAAANDLGLSIGGNKTDLFNRVAEALGLVD
jgi:hypothetical protein